MGPDPSPELAAIVHAAQLAAARLRADLERADITVAEKGPADFVSSADLASQAILERELGRAFPDCDLVLEEGDVRPTTAGARRLLVDPLDGTTNFLHRIPHFAVSIALVAPEGTLAGVVLNVATGELFCAERGSGAWLAGPSPRRLAVSGKHRLSEAVVGTGIPHRGGRNHAAFLAALARVMVEATGIRRLGSAALDLAYVAAGRFDAFFELGLAPWDVAAGSLLVTEAGGVVTRSDGTAAALDGRDILAACDPALHRTMIEKLAPLYAPRLLDGAR